MSIQQTLAHPAQAGRTHALAQAPATLAEDAFDRLNPDFGVPADAYDPAGHQAVQDREAALALGTRSAVALIHENEPNPLVRLASQDDRVAAAVRATRPRARQGPSAARRSADPARAARDRRR